MKRICLFIALSFLVLNNYAQNKISYKEAHKHVGEVVTVSGKLGPNKVDSKGFDILFSMGEDIDRLLTIHINGGDRKNFSYKPEQVYANKNVLVTGKVTASNGKPEIIVSNSSQIKLQEQVASGGIFNPLDITNVCKWCDNFQP